MAKNSSRLTPLEQAQRVPPVKPGSIAVLPSVEALCKYLEIHRYEVVGWRNGILVVKPAAKAVFVKEDGDE